MCHITLSNVLYEKTIETMFFDYMNNCLHRIETLQGTNFYEQNSSLHKFMCMIHFVEK
jgi:hypothetical protein